MKSIKFKIKNYSLLTVGGGSTIGYADIMFNPLGISGASVKGAMRTAINQFLPEGYTSCGEIEPELIKEKHKGGKPCDVCKLFGYPDSRIGGCINVVFNGEVKSEDKVTITRVKIKDDAQVAEEGALFTEEAVKTGKEYEFTLIFNDRECDERMLRLALYSLLALRLWRLGRNAMIDVKVEYKCEDCEEETKKLLNLLSHYLWEGVNVE